MVPFSFARDVRCNVSRRTGGIREIVSLVEADLFAGLEKKKKSENERKLFLGELEKEILNDEYRNVSAISNHRIGWLDDRYSSNGVKLLNFYNFP